MTHPFLTEQLASAHLAELHAEVARARLTRSARRRRFDLLRRRARGTPSLPLLLVENLEPVAGDVDVDVAAARAQVA